MVRSTTLTSSGTAFSSYSLRWNTKCDCTEVILNGYLAMGTAFFSRLNGIFAFSIYDHNSGEMLLARDPMGSKTLFIRNIRILWFSAQNQRRSLLMAYLRWQTGTAGMRYLPWDLARTPGKGGFKNMREGSSRRMPDLFQLLRMLPIITARSISSGRWKPHIPQDSYPDTVEKVKWLIEDSIQRQMVSDIPICSFCPGTGQILVSAICQKHLKRAGRTQIPFPLTSKITRENFQANAFQSSLWTCKPFCRRNGAEHMRKPSPPFWNATTRPRQIICTKRLMPGISPCMADVESSMLYFCELVSKIQSGRTDW